MNLGFHYHIPATIKNGAIYMPGYLGCFVDSLAEHCEKLTCFLHSPTAQEEQFLDYQIQSSQVRWVDLGTHSSVPKRLLRSRQITKTIKQNIRDVDMLLLRAPTPLLPIISKAVGDFPTALLLVGDNLSGVDEMRQPFWRKELIRLLWRWNKSQQTKLAQRSLTFVNSHKLYGALKDSIPNLVETRTTTLSQNDFFKRENTCKSPPYHLLYTGRIEKAKGLCQLIEATALLVQEGHDLILDIVGWAAEGDSILDELSALVEKKGVQEQVIFHGFKPLGEALFEMYRNADIYVLASLAEGFPRTIWEAMANSLPVVATKVGSIPYLIENSAELIEPENTKNLAIAIEKLLNTPDLRRRYIRKGFALAKENTLEVQSYKMIEQIKFKLNHQDTFI